MFSQTVEIPSRTWVMTSGRESRPVNSIFNITLFRKPQLLKSGFLKKKIQKYMKMSLVKNIKQLIPYYRFTDYEFKKVKIMLSLLKVFGLG